MECNEIYSISSFIEPENNRRQDNSTSAGLGNRLWISSRSGCKNIDGKKGHELHMVAAYTAKPSTGQENGAVNKDSQVTFQNAPEPDSDVAIPETRSPCGLRKDLLGIKLFYLSWIGALGCVLPFVAVFLKQMGLSPFQIGIISGLRPAIGFISGPIWGNLADKFNIRRILLIISLTAWLSFYIGLYFIPNAARVTQCPESLQPHRDHIPVRVRRSLNVTSNLTTAMPDLTGSKAPTLFSNITYNLTAEEIRILKEDLGWTYESSSLHRVFITSLLVIVSGEFFQAPTGALSDTGTLETLGPDGLNNYGAQRAWGAIGWAACSLLGGGIVSSTRQDFTMCNITLTISDYHMLVYVFIAFMVIAYIAAMTIRFKKFKGSTITRPGSTEEEDKKHTFLGVIKVFWNVHYGSWILTTFYVGVCNGVIWGFLYWHLDNLGGTQLLMGLCGVVACVSEFISFHFVNTVTKWIGHMGIMYTGLLGYGIRFLVYGFLKNPWWVMPAEILQGVTFALIWASLTSYTALAVPATSLATVQGIVHGVYFGLGNGLGHFLGGVLIHKYGAVVTFLGFAVSCAFVLLIFLTAQKLSKKPDKSFAYQDLDHKS